MKPFVNEFAWKINKVEGWRKWRLFIIFEYKM